MPPTSAPTSSGSAPTDAPLRYGFVGAGMMGQEHIRNVVALPGAVVAAVADLHAASVQAAREAAEADVPAYPDVESMIAAEALDVVVVSTPNHTHRRVLEPLWGTSLHLLIEKPLCTTVEDCVAVRDAAADHEGIVWVGLEYRYMPPVQRFLQELAAPEVGRVHSMSVREHRFPFLEKVDDWNRFSANTGGTLVEKCCHFFDLMRLAVPGEPVRVMASGAQDVNHLDERYDAGIPDILDNAFVIVDFDSGARAMLDLSMFAEGAAYEQELVAVGDRGRVQVELPGIMERLRGRPAVLTVGSRGEGWPVEQLELGEDDRVRYEGAHHGASYLEHVDLAHAIRNGGDAAVRIDDGLWSVAMGQAAHRSIDEGRPVRMDEVGLPPDLLSTRDAGR